MPQAAKACSKLIPLATRTVHLLLDRERHVVGVLAGHPNDKRWGQVHEDAFTKLQQAASTMSYSDKERNNRRGLFPNGDYVACSFILDFLDRHRSDTLRAAAAICRPLLFLPRCSGTAADDIYLTAFKDERQSEVRGE